MESRKRGTCSILRMVDPIGACAIQEIERPILGRVDASGPPDLDPIVSRGARAVSLRASHANVQSSSSARTGRTLNSSRMDTTITPTVPGEIYRAEGSREMIQRHVTGKTQKDPQRNRENLYRGLSRDCPIARSFFRDSSVEIVCTKVFQPTKRGGNTRKGFLFTANVDVAVFAVVDYRAKRKYLFEMERTTRIIARACSLGPRKKTSRVVHAR